MVVLGLEWHGHAIFVRGNESLVRVELLHLGDKFHGEILLPGDNCETRLLLKRKELVILKVRFIMWASCEISLNYGFGCKKT